MKIDKSSAENIRLLSLYRGGRNLLSCSQLPINLQKAWNESNRSVTLIVPRQTAGFYS